MEFSKYNAQTTNGVSFNTSYAVKLMPVIADLIATRTLATLTTTRARAGGEG